MKKALAVLMIFFLLYSGLTKSARAIVDPLLVPNNKIGIHILDPNEVDQVAELVNGGGGQWGYVTVPIRDDDRDRVKWQSFMDKCRELKLIPIIRLATVMKPGSWESPTLLQSLDFANFLNGLTWPTQNRYIIIYNEPNHATEWDGFLDPTSYAVILKYTSQIFKQRSSDFFILPAGFDAAAPDNSGHLSIYNFINQMIAAEPDVFDYIDGWTSHSYPNPGFSGSPSDTSSRSIASFKHELDYLSRLTDKKLPVFITETGWRDDLVGENNTANFYSYAFNNVWNDSLVVAVTPFIYQGGGSVFSPFSFIKENGEKKMIYQTISAMPKIKGEPQLKPAKNFAQVLGIFDKASGSQQFGGYKDKQPSLPAFKWRQILSWLMIY